MRARLAATPDRRTNFGVIVNFLRMCNSRIDVSRADLVLAILEPWADLTDTPLDHLRSAVRASGYWTSPILRDNKIDAAMLEWAVDVDAGGPRVGLAVDVLWFIVAQALYAGEWGDTPAGPVAVVHTRNMSCAAQTLLSLYLHTSVPKAAVPACGPSGVVLSEPSQHRELDGHAICIAYHPALHVDSGEDGAGFVNAALREPRHMCLVHIGDAGTMLVSRNLRLLDAQASVVGEQVLAEADVCPFPPEAVAHMPALSSLMRVFKRMHDAHPELRDDARCLWAVATRMLGAGAAPLGFLPVALTQHALDEDVPCVSYAHGFCFVLRVADGRARLAPVDIEYVVCHDVPALRAHSSFQPLPPGDVCFPAEELAHAMAGGLVLRGARAAYVAPALLREDADADTAHDVPLPFAFMPIVRFQCLLMLELDVRADGTTGMRPYSESRARPLTVAVLHTHPSPARDAFLLDGRYHVRYTLAAADGARSEAAATVDYVLASQCMLRDGAMLQYTLTPPQLQQLIDELIEQAADNNPHVRLRRLAHVQPPPGDIALTCHYTLSHQPRRAALAGDAGTRVRIALTLIRHRQSDAAPTIVYADVPLFDERGASRLHVHDPLERTVFEHFEWC